MDFDSVSAAGSRLGTGTMIVLDDRTCPVGMVHNLTKFFARESCGWCTPCRDNLPWAATTLEALEDGRGRAARPGQPGVPVPNDGARPHVLCLGPGAAEPLQSALEILSRRFPAAHHREALPLEVDRVATIYIDNRPYVVKDGQNLLRACLSLGFDLPYFCWHPAMHSVGACRQCAVKQFKDENDTKGRIVMACMTLAADGTRISIDDPEARAFRAGVIELLMVNHPHDCPVCDEGGECHLQDMTVMTGHTYRRFRFQKRTHRNQDLGPLVNHEMNRCIACYRCVRFYRDYAGGRDFDVFQWHNHVYFGRHADGTLENEFSGNLVEICPTGVFTDKTLKRHYTRKWDLQTAPSICVHCGVGCNTIPGERYGLLRRIRNRYHRDVNGYFLCDRGRYGYEFVNSPRRIRQAMLRIGRTSRPDRG